MTDLAKAIRRRTMGIHRGKPAEDAGRQTCEAQAQMTWADLAAAAGRNLDDCLRELAEIAERKCSHDRR